MNRLRVRYERDTRLFTPLRETTQEYLSEHILLTLHVGSIEQLFNHRQIQNFVSNGNTNSRRGLNHGFKHLSPSKPLRSPTLLLVEKIP